MILEQNTKQSGLFSDLVELLNINDLDCIPKVEQLNSWALKFNEFSQLKLSFVSQDEGFDWQQQYYEQVIYQRRMIPTRLEHWHDFFNACIWFLFPKTKAVLNRLHIEQIKLFGLTQRSKTRDAITFLDECGVVIAVNDEAIKAEFRSHQWRRVFVDKKPLWGQSLDAFIFGHAIYETALKPFIGFTGKAYFVDVESGFFVLNRQQQYLQLDSILAKQIEQEDTLNDNSLLSPLPILGVPSWYDDNEQATFYDNTDYFRPKRVAKKVKQQALPIPEL